MTLAAARSIRSLAIVAALAAPPAPARALVGAAPDGRFADRVAMVLIRGGDSAGFCSALVLGPRVLLTAAHCLRPLRDMAVHYRDGAGAAVIIPVDAAIPHPLYRADAIRARVESIDLALIRTARPLDPRFVAAAIGDSEPPAIGARAIVSGFGAAREGDWSSGGTLRSVTLAVREPRSTVLIWAADPDGKEAGACSGNSGLPSGRPTDRRRSRSSPGRRRPMARGAAASPRAPCLPRSRAGSRRPSANWRPPAREISRGRVRDAGSAVLRRFLDNFFLIRGISAVLAVSSKASPMSAPAAIRAPPGERLCFGWAKDALPLTRRAGP